MIRRLTAILVAFFTAASATARAAEATTFESFTVTTRYQICNDISLYASGSWCGVPSDATFAREVSGSPQGDFVNSVDGTGGNPVLATKAKGTVTYTLVHTLERALPAIDLTFAYRLDRLEAAGTGFCGVIMSANSGCLYASGSATFTATPPAGGHLCADGRDDSASYPFGDTYFHTLFSWAKPGPHEGGFFLRCHYANVSVGTTFTLTFTTSTAISPSGETERAVVAGHFGPVVLAGSP